MSGERADVRVITDHDLESGVPQGPELLAFAEDIVRNTETLVKSRAAVMQALSPAAMVDAAGVASNFERMVRIADATGIELGASMKELSADARTALSLERPSGR